MYAVLKNKESSRVKNFKKEVEGKKILVGVFGCERVKAFISNLTRKQKIALCIIPILFIILILLIFMPTSPISMQEDGEQIVYQDSIDIGSIVSNVSSPISSIKTFTNEYSDESSLILSELGVDMQSIASYSANVDTRYESAHAIVIVRPKVEYYTECKKALANYIARKQRELNTLNNISGSDTYKGFYQTSLNSLIYEHGEYLILVMEDNEQSISEKIIQDIDKNLSGNT